MKEFKIELKPVSKGIVSVYLRGILQDGTRVAYGPQQVRQAELASVVKDWTENPPDMREMARVHKLAVQAAHKAAQAGE